MATVPSMWPPIFCTMSTPEVAAEGEPYQRSEADIVFESVCDFTAWPAIGIRVLAGD